MDFLKGYIGTLLTKERGKRNFKIPISFNRAVLLFFQSFYWKGALEGFPQLLEEI